MINLFNNIFEQRKVFITGHTGFKGSWLTQWLTKMGAIVYGYSLQSSTTPNHHSQLDKEYQDTIGDINNFDSIYKAISEFKPEVVFHLAAQPLVGASYTNPISTLNTNIIGTANLLECICKTPSVKAGVIITTDKCYKNTGKKKCYSECDILGGSDPYSASKACAELVVDCYRESFCQTNKQLIATARAGNVIGGGDWTPSRLIPDIIISAIKKETLCIRHPEATRPWQHVLDSLSGYLLLAQKLFEGEEKFSQAWNFGPPDNKTHSVSDIINIAKNQLGSIQVSYDSTPSFKEEMLLSINSIKSRNELGWASVWDTNSNFITKTIEWYKEFYRGNIITDRQIKDYVKDAKKLGLNWAK